MSSAEMRQRGVRLGSSYATVTYPQMLDRWFDGVTEPVDANAELQGWVRLHAGKEAGSFDVLASVKAPAFKLGLGDALATFWERVGFILIDDLRDAIALHAAALCHDNCFIMVPGHSGTGKTRLSLWYRAQGFDLGTDEVVTASLGPKGTDDLIIGGVLRRPVILKDWGDPNALLRPAETPVERQDSSYGLLLRLAGGASWTQRPVDRGLVVFPRFVPGAPFKLIALTPGEAALRLIKNCLNARNLPRGGLPFASLMARRLPAIALDYGETSQLDGTLDVLTRVLATSATPDDMAALCAALTGSKSRYERRGPDHAENADPKQKPADDEDAADILISRWYGRFGNNMHQYAFAATYAHTHNSRAIMPEWWEGVDIFDIPEFYLPDRKLRTNLNALRRRLMERGTIKYMEKYYEENDVTEKERYREIHIGKDCYAPVFRSDGSKSKVAVEDMCAYHEAVF